MHRRIAPLFLAVLVALPVVAPASAAEPLAPPAVGTGDDTAAPRPTRRRRTSRRPSPSPSAEPTAPPDADPAPDAGLSPRDPGRRAGRPGDGTRDPRRDRPLHRHAPQRERHRGRRVPGSAPRPCQGRPDATPAACAAIPRSWIEPSAPRSWPTRASAPIVPDGVVQLTQTVPTGVARVGGRLSDIAAIDGTDHRVDADVAIVDTGISYHPDLNVAGGYNCSTADHAAWRDHNNHGTHVAGTVGALDNGIGVVGVAPGRPGVGRQDPQRRRLRPHLVVHLRPRLDPRPARPGRRQPAALRGGQHERHEAGLRRPQLRLHQQRPAPPGDLPRRRGRHHGRRRGRQRPPQRRQEHPGQLQRGDHRLGPRRHGRQGRRRRRQPLLLVGHLRQGRHVRRLQQLRRATSTSSRRANASCRRSRAPATRTCPGRRWRPRPSPARWRSTRRAGRTRRRPRSARRCATSATSTGRRRPTPTRPTSRCSTCRGSGTLGTFDFGRRPRRRHGRRGRHDRVDPGHARPAAARSSSGSGCRSRRCPTAGPAAVARPA